jgi:hypothetical protein
MSYTNCYFRQDDVHFLRDTEGNERENFLMGDLVMWKYNAKVRGLGIVIGCGIVDTQSRKIVNYTIMWCNGFL